MLLSFKPLLIIEQYTKAGQLENLASIYHDFMAYWLRETYNILVGGYVLFQNCQTSVKYEYCLGLRDH